MADSSSVCVFFRERERGFRERKRGFWRENEMEWNGMKLREWEDREREFIEVITKDREVDQSIW